MISTQSEQSEKQRISKVEGAQRDGQLSVNLYCRMFPPVAYRQLVLQI